MTSLDSDNQLNQPLLIKNSYYSDFKWCQNKLLKKHKSNEYLGYGGINCFKYNYSNERFQNVKIWFSRNLQTLYYKNPDKLFSSSINIKDIQGVLFGAISSTFNNHQRFVPNYDRFQALSQSK